MGGKVPPPGGFVTGSRIPPGQRDFTATPTGSPAMALSTAVLKTCMVDNFKHQGDTQALQQRHSSLFTRLIYDYCITSRKAP